MDYISTRGKIAPVGAAYAAAATYAADGGLFVPERMPREINDSDINCLAWLSDGRKFGYLAGRFMREMYIGFISEIGDRAYREEAFAGIDFALRPLPLLFEYCLSAVGKGAPYTLGYGVEPDPSRQPVIAVPSDNEVSLALARYMKADGGFLMRADTQSWFGVMSYMTQFISLYCEMILGSEITLGGWVNLEIPYDDMLEAVTAAFYAREMGMKIEKIVCAAPDGSVLHTLVTQGVLAPGCVRDGEFVPVALERLLYALGVSIPDVLLSGKCVLPEAAAEKLREAFSFEGTAQTTIKIAKTKTETVGLLINSTDIRGELEK